MRGVGRRSLWGMHCGLSETWGTRFGLVLVVRTAYSMPQGAAPLRRWEPILELGLPSQHMGTWGNTCPAVLAAGFSSSNRLAKLEADL